MRTYIFFRGEAVIGVIACPNDLALNQEHTDKIQKAGISVIIKTAKIPGHDGDVNRLVDTLIENDWL